MEAKPLFYAVPWNQARTMSFREPGVELTDLWKESSSTSAVLRVTPEFETREEWEQRVTRQYGPVSSLNITENFPHIPGH